MIIRLFHAKIIRLFTQKQKQKMKTRLHKKPAKKTACKYAFDKALLTWRAPEYHQHEKSAWWFIIAGMAAAVLIFYGIKTDGWTFSIAVAVFAAVYYLMHREQPPIVDVKISEAGVKVGHHIFPYSHLKYFWIIYDPPFVKRLYLRETSRFHPEVFISLEDTNPAQVRAVLSRHTEELKGKHEPFSDSLVRLFRL